MDVWEANCSCKEAGYRYLESSVKGLEQTWGKGITCSGLPSLMDVSTKSMAAARESAAEVLRELRQLARESKQCTEIEGSGGTVVWPEQSAVPVLIEGSNGSSRSFHADWEVFQAELLSASSARTHACGGGCGVRYCSLECQAQGWRDGHRLSCGQLRDRRASALSAEEWPKSGGPDSEASVPVL